jgi:hypothetical protein
MLHDLQKELDKQQDPPRSNDLCQCNHEYRDHMGTSGSCSWIVGDAITGTKCMCASFEPKKADLLLPGWSEVSDSDTPSTVLPCPSCHKTDGVYMYKWEGKDEGWCNDCGVNFTEKGVLEIDQDPKTFLNSSAIKHDTKITRVKTPGGSEEDIYTCTHPDCKFETKFSSEAIVHSTVNNKPKDFKEDLHYSEFVRNGEWKCEFCDKTFTNFSDANAHDTPQGRIKHNSKYTGSTFVGTDYTPIKTCKHPPQHVINGETWGVWAGKRNDCEDVLDEYDFALNLTGSRVYRKHQLPKALVKWEMPVKEYVLDWPDRGLPGLPKAFWTDLVNYLKKDKLRMVMFCIGGHGRTGTALASLMVVGLGWKPKEAIEWIHKNYCEEAIETMPQTQYVYRLAGETYTPPKNNKPADNKIVPMSYYDGGAWD